MRQFLAESLRKAKRLPSYLRGLNAPIDRQNRLRNSEWVAPVPLGPRDKDSAPHNRKQDSPVMFAVLGAWNEADIVYATVRNALEQGARRVFVIDDASDDETPAEAEAAGAEVRRFPSMGGYDEAERMARYQRLIDEETRLAGREVWWLCLDADEFHRGPSGSSVLDLVAGLDPSVTVVGARVLDHYPVGAHDYTRRSHPITSQPIARWHAHPYCPRGHWKHPLFVVRQPGDVRVLAGFHRHEGRRGRLIEAELSLLTHHFPFRNRDFLESKLRTGFAEGGRLAAATDSVAAFSAGERLRNLDLVYRGEWSKVRSVVPGTKRYGLDLRPWQDLVPPSERRYSGFP